MINIWPSFCSFPVLLQAVSPYSLLHIQFGNYFNTQPSSLLATVTTFLSARTIVFEKSTLPRQNGNVLFCHYPGENTIFYLAQLKWTMHLHEKMVVSSQQHCPFEEIVAQHFITHAIHKMKEHSKCNDCKCTTLDFEIRSYFNAQFPEMHLQLPHVTTRGQYFPHFVKPVLSIFSAPIMFNI